MTAAASAGSVPGRLVEMSADVRAAVLVDAAGNLVAASEPDRERARRLAELVRELVSAADGASPVPVEQIEAHVDGGSVFAMRSAGHTIGCVTRRLALPSLILYDLRHSLREADSEAAP